MRHVCFPEKNSSQQNLIFCGNQVSENIRIKNLIYYNNTVYLLSGT